MADKMIAVVNDDTAFLSLMNDLLNAEGYATLLCVEGDKAYETIKKKQPDLVILDIRMERPDTGWMVLELIRLDPTTTSIPIIACSADAIFLRAKAELLKKHGCDILEKPFELKDLLQKVNTAIGPPAGRSDDSSP
jgi:CheY-like chemotaxis protein